MYDPVSDEFARASQFDPKYDPGSAEALVALTKAMTSDDDGSDDDDDEVTEAGDA
jgi:hypothetical protein